MINADKIFIWRHNLTSKYLKIMNKIHWSLKNFKKLP
jgi:hypothetical protein